MEKTANIISRQSTLLDALARLNRLSGHEMTLFVVDSPEDMRVLGSLTGGDIRRALLAGVGLNDPVTSAMFTGFRAISHRPDPAQVDMIRAMRSQGITMVPVVDAEGRLTDIADLTVRPSRLPLTAILMAGGKGERLRPLTLERPKPLLEVDGKAIIDYNIEALSRVGISDITVTTRYLAEQIHRHFEEPVCGVRVKCVTETRPMGTVGSAALVDIPKKGNTLVMNSDLLTTVSFEDMYIKHRDTGAAITVGVIPYQVSVPYAILTTDGDNVTAIEEKPSFSHYANAGIYIFDNEILASLPDDAPTDAPDLIRNAINSGARVTYFVIDGTWIDIGSHTDFKHARELMRHHRNLSGQPF